MPTMVIVVVVVVGLMTIVVVGGYGSEGMYTRMGTGRPSQGRV